MSDLIKERGIVWVGQDEDCGCYPGHVEGEPIPESCKYINLDFDVGTLDELITKFTNLRTQVANRFPQFVDFNVYFGDYLHLVVDGMRPETHAERNKRITKAQKSLERKKKNLEKKKAEIAALEAELA